MSDGDTPPSSKKRKRDQREVQDSTNPTDVAKDETDSPVKSHKERRREKRLVQRAATLNSSGVSEALPAPEVLINEPKSKKKGGERAEDKEPDPARQPRQNSVWVGNLAFKTREKDLRQFFSDVGEITRVNLPMKNALSFGGKVVGGDNMGFAYVDFATPDAKTIAIALSEGNLDGRKLLIKDGGDFSGRPTAAAAATTEASQGQLPSEAKSAGSTHTKTEQKIIRAQTQPPSVTLFMGNLPFQATTESIKGMLEAHRTSRIAKKSKRKHNSEDSSEVAQAVKDVVWLRKIRLGTFEDTGKCKGWAFLDFMTLEEATSALLDIRNHHMDGRDIKLEYASPDATKRGEPKSKTGLKRKTHPVEGGEDEGRPERPPFKKPRESRQPSERSDRLNARLGRKPRPDQEVDETEETAEVDDSETIHKDHSEKAHRKAVEGKPERRPKYKTRIRPGAALAMAKRENVAIVKSEGVKTKFD